jgi:hypothetical protein
MHGRQLYLISTFLCFLLLCLITPIILFLLFYFYKSKEKSKAVPVTGRGGL